MTTKFLTWLLIVLSAQVLSGILAFEDFFASKNRGFNISTHDLMQERGLHVEDGMITRGGEYEQGTVNSRKTQIGKGSYGGANLVHHPRPAQRNTAVSFLKRPSGFIPTMILVVISFGSVSLLVPLLAD